jgi:N-acetylmuramic acid 6-phosphate etherase
MDKERGKKASARIRRNYLRPFAIILLALVYLPQFLSPNHEVRSQENKALLEQKTTLLGLLQLIPSPESIDYMQTKTSYQLQTLPTEQRHPKTWNLSDRTAQNMEAGLRMLLAVDEDIEARIKAIVQDSQVLERAVQAIHEAILSDRKIYLFGCQETGRWAKWVESSIWRPFWKGLRARKKIWAKIGPRVGDSIENRVIGEMPGADRALISPLEGWNDLMITGRLQFQEREVEPGDLVFCISASGESPAVIGTLYEALDRWTRRYPYDVPKIQKKLFFIFNNPERVLLPFDRCKIVLEEPGITKINCATGPQAVAGATRMQASTIDAFLVAQLLQVAIDRSLRPFLSEKEMGELGFEAPFVLEEKLGEFSTILKDVKKILPALASSAIRAEKASRDEHCTTYSALRGFNTLFNDCAEQGSTFHDCPLDSVKIMPRKSPIQVWAPAPNLEKAWEIILGHPFRGLNPTLYKIPLEKESENRDLIQTVMESLDKGGNDQQYLFDFSMSDFNLRLRGPEKKDMGIFAIMSPEEIHLEDEGSMVNRFIRLFLDKGAGITLLFITEKKEKDIKNITRKIPGFDTEGKDILAILPMESSNDPLCINRLIALKIILNAHSTAVMAKAGRIIANTVTAVDTDNPRSIGRATSLIVSHVNDVLKKPVWVKQHGIMEPVTYGEANAVLFDTMHFMEGQKKMMDRPYDVDLSIIRILECLRLKKTVSNEEAWTVVRDIGLQKYLKDVVS